MKDRLWTLGVLLACTVLACAALALPAGAAGQGVAAQASAPARGDAPTPTQWTFILYLCSDNDLDEWGALNVEWLMSAPASDEVNFLVFWDPSTGPARLLEVSHGSAAEVGGFALHGVEVNMGDPATLVALLDFIEAEYPADKVVLDLWDHGDDFTGICYDYDTGTAAEFDKLSHQEIVAALAGRDVDILAADGCGIGVVEAAYEYVSGGVTAGWFVASETYVPLLGFPYDTIAADLVADPGMDPEQLAKVMVERYAELYRKGWLTSLSAIRLPAVGAMVEELWDVTAILMSDMRAYRGLVAAGKAKATMGWSQYGWEASVDLPTVFEVVHRKAPAKSELKAETAELLDAVAEAVPYMGAPITGYAGNFGGIAVFFPGSWGSFTNNTFWRGSLYPQMRFAQDGWQEFLSAYFGGAKRKALQAQPAARALR